MTSPTDLRTLSITTLFPLVQEVLKFVKKHESYSAQNVTRFYGRR